MLCNSKVAGDINLPSWMIVELRLLSGSLTRFQNLTVCAWKNTPHFSWPREIGKMEGTDLNTTPCQILFSFRFWILYWIARQSLVALTMGIPALMKYLLFPVLVIIGRFDTWPLTMSCSFAVSSVQGNFRYVLHSMILSRVIIVWLHNYSIIFKLWG